MGYRTAHSQLGKLVNMNPVSSTITTNTIPTRKQHRSPTIKPKTRTIRISEPIYDLLKDHSKKFHSQPISYDEIFEELCTYSNANHEQKWFLT